MNTAPERIHVNLNAADGYTRFKALGLEITTDSKLTPEQLHAMLAAEQRRLFRLVGRVAGFASEVVLKIDAATDGSFTLTNCHEPPFTDTYAVAPEPPPYVNHHGDYVFDLVKR